ncbi:MAG: DUF4465 domain-containing protein [Chitinophagaceae bacterium]|nr:MAG: DUF4465 domain-containing protein [Chitinophagaceae bacterium]
MIMKKTIYSLIGLISIAFFSCSDKKDLIQPYNDDITLNEISLDDFSYNVPENGFKSGIVNFNTKKNVDGTFAGFAYSNRNNRSFTWQGNQAALDSNIFSVYTARYNRTETFAVASVVDDEAFFTLSTPSVIEHVLLANTSYNYLAMNYGDQYGTTSAKVANPNIKAAPLGVWYSYVTGGVKKMNDTDKDYFKVIIQGYKSGAATQKVEFYLCSKKYPANDETQSYLLNDWYKCDLTALGVVDKVVFHLESSDNLNGKMRTPSYFCLDGIRIKK